jgi:DNA-3-methyladenine glycosylase
MRTLFLSKKIDGLDLCSSDRIWFEDDCYRVGRVAVTRRIGVTRDVNRLLRFYIYGSPWVSRKNSPPVRRVIEM